MTAEEIQVQVQPQPETQTQEPMFTLAGPGLVKINTDRNVDCRLKTNGKYIMHLPETDEVVYLNCYGVAIRAADLTILNHIKAGKPVTYDLDCTFGYQFETFDTVYFNSFARREKCVLYAVEDIYVMKEIFESRPTPEN
jgi:hypothetical protein